MVLRQANQADRIALAHLIQHSPHVHTHLGWRSPLDWLGTGHPYMVMVEAERVVAALACSQEIYAIAWIQLFVVSSQVSVHDAWNKLWPRVRLHLETGTSIIALPMQEWFESLLHGYDFTRRDQIAMLDWVDRGQRIEASPFDPRLMQPDDLEDVYSVDKQSFEPVWRQSRDQLAIARQEAVHATVIEHGGDILGYQISTTSAGDGHLARLAVLPEARNQGIGQSLVADALSHFRSQGFERVTVNTQVDNLSSLALYQKMGFRQLAETYSVYQYHDKAFAPL
jgi:ribosomal-protein-alanine N-acetyltransferase